MAPPLDVLKAELEALRKQRIDAKLRLDADRAPIGGFLRPTPSMGAAPYRPSSGPDFGARGMPPPSFSGRLGSGGGGGGDGYHFSASGGGALDPRNSHHHDNSRPSQERRPLPGGREPVPLYRARGGASGPEVPGAGAPDGSRPRPSVFSRVGSVTGSFAHSAGGDAPDSRGNRFGPPQQAGELEDGETLAGAGQDGFPSAGGRKRVLSSAVVVEEGVRRGMDTRLDSRERPSAVDEPPPRPSGDALTADPTQKKRARRMFGALMGTLQKFKEESAQEEASGTVQRRAEVAKRAEGRQAAQALEAKKAVSQARSDQRRQNLQNLQNLNLATTLKALEVATAERVARRALSHGGAFLLSVALPALLWAPALHNDATLRQQQQRQLAHQVWESAVVAELEAEKARLVQDFQERAAANKAREEAAAAARAGGGTAAVNGHHNEAQQAGGGDDARMSDAQGGDGDHDAERVKQEDEELAGFLDYDGVADHGSRKLAGRQAAVGAQAVAAGATAAAAAPGPAASGEEAAAVSDAAGGLGDRDAPEDKEAALDDGMEEEPAAAVGRQGGDEERAATVEDLIMGT